MRIRARNTIVQRLRRMPPYAVEWDFRGLYGFSGEDPGAVLFTSPGT